MKVVLLAAMSVDGKIAESRDQNSTDWTSKDDVRFFVKKTKEVGTLIMGSATYETIGRPLPGRKIFVMCFRPEKHEPIEGVEFIKKGPKEMLEYLEEQGIESVVIAGGASIYRQFIEQGLVDELFLTVEPYLFGKGIPFVPEMDRVKLSFVDMEQIGEQTITLHYSVNKLV